MSKWGGKDFFFSPQLPHTREAKGSSPEPILFWLGSIFILEGE